jgi:hypothetical protein
MSSVIFKYWLLHGSSELDHDLAEYDGKLFKACKLLRSYTGESKTLSYYRICSSLHRLESPYLERPSSMYCMIDYVRTSVHRERLDSAVLRLHSQHNRVAGFGAVQTFLSAYAVLVACNLG